MHFQQRRISFFHKALPKEETNMIPEPIAVLQENRNSDFSLETIQLEEMGTASAPALFSKQKAVLHFHGYHTVLISKNRAYFE